MVALEERRERGVHCDLLALVGGIDLKVVIVDGDFLVRVVGEEGELDGGVEGGAREGELVDVELFEGELGLGRTEDEPDEENEKEEYGDE